MIGGVSLEVRNCIRDCLCLARVASSRVIGVGGSMRVAMYGMLRAREKAISLGVLSNRVGEEEGVEVTSRAYGVSVAVREVKRMIIGHLPFHNRRCIESKVVVVEWWAGGNGGGDWVGGRQGHSQVGRRPWASNTNKAGM